MSADQSITTRPVTTWLCAAYIAGVAILLLIAAGIVVCFSADVPLRDQWRILATYLARPGLSGLWTPQNGHITFFPALVYRADMAWFGAGGGLLLWVMHLCNAGVALFIAQIALKAENSPAYLRYMSAGFALFCLYWMGNTLHLTWSQGVAHHLTVFAVVCALWAAQRGAGAEGRSAWAWLGLSLFSALVAGFSFGNGLLVWPLLLAVAWLAGLSRRLLALIAVVAALAITTYLLSAPGAGGGAWQRATPRHFIDLALIFMGAPVAHALDFLVPVTTRATVEVARVGGIVLLASGMLMAVWVLWLKRNPAAVLGLAIMALVVGTAILVAWARVEQFGPAVGASQRYVIWGMLYLAAMAATLPHLVGDRGAPTVATGLLIVTLFMLSTHLSMARSSAVITHQSNETVLALAVGVHDDDRVVAHLADSGRADIVYKVAKQLKKHHLNPFNDAFMHLPGSRLKDSFNLVSVDRCQGALERIDPAPGSAPKGWRVFGWAWDVEAAAPAQSVVLINRGGEINGIARMSRSWGRDDASRGLLAGRPGAGLAKAVSPHLPGMLGIGNGWFGYAKPSRGILALAVLADGSSVCPLTTATR
jgi:hypothetical protein